jgi:hypothetical protein
MKTLYHYTCLAHVEKIIADGRIMPTDSCLFTDRAKGDKSVVWLTTDAECKYPHGLQFSGLAGFLTGKQMDDETRERWDKTRVRITLALPNSHVFKWRAWHDQQHGEDIMRRRLIKSAGGGSSTWRVVEHPIMSDRWIEVLDRQTGQPLWAPTRRAPQNRCSECRQFVPRENTVNAGHKMDCSAGPRAAMVSA